MAAPEEAQAGIAIAEGALAAAEEGVRLVRVRYENGLAPMVTLLDAQSALNRARSDAARAHAGAASALGELLFRAGVGAGLPGERVHGHDDDDNNGYFGNTGRRTDEADILDTRSGGGGASRAVGRVRG